MKAKEARAFVKCMKKDYGAKNNSMINSAVATQGIEIAERELRKVAIESACYDQKYYSCEAAGISNSKIN